MCLQPFWVDINFCRAGWGVSGALYLQSAIAGSISRPRLLLQMLVSSQAVLRAGPCAIDTCEPRQVRKEAAVSEDAMCRRYTWFELAVARQFVVVVDVGCEASILKKD